MKNSGKRRSGADGDDATLEATFSRRRTERDGGAWAVSDVDLDDGKKLCVVGPMLDPAPGRRVRLHGVERAAHPIYGDQAKYRSYEWLGWGDLRGMARHLADSCDGIGETLAGRIVAALGEAAFDLLASDPDGCAAKVDGLRVEIARAAAAKLAENRELADLQALLRGAGIGVARIKKMIDRYGARGTAAKIQADPWSLAREVDGIGFATADALAMKIKHPPDSPLRARAALEHAASEARDDGHAWTACRDVPKILEKAKVSIPIETLGAAIEEARKPGLSCGVTDSVDDGPVVYPVALLADEAEIRETFLRLTRAEFPLPKWDDGILDGLKLDSSQRAAVDGIRGSRVGIVTGCPGTGKSYTISAIHDALASAGARVAVMAPTGKAAMRIREMSGGRIDASTIHMAVMRAEAKGEELGADVVVVDESSMVSVDVLAWLVRALPRDCCLYMVGDVDQLPPVGPGAPFRDAIARGLAPCWRLETCHRTRPGSVLARNAVEINEGRAPMLGVDDTGTEIGDFFLFESDDDARSAEILVDVVARRLPGRFRIPLSGGKDDRAADPVADIQVVAPQRKGACGTEALNERLRAALNPPSGPAGIRGYRVGDKLIQKRNDYALGVMNGEIGVAVTLGRKGDRAPAALILAGKLEERPKYDWLAVDFSGRPRDARGGLRAEVAADCSIYTQENSSHLHLAYAITVHSMQGSECPWIVMPVVRSHWYMLTRRLLYTGITRAKQKCVLVGQRRALDDAIRRAEDGSAARRTFLSAWAEGKIAWPVAMPGRKIDADGAAAGAAASGALVVGSRNDAGDPPTSG